MHNEHIEHWQALCKEAEQEQDPERLLVLCTEINRLLEEKKDRNRAIRESSEDR